MIPVVTLFVKGAGAAIQTHL